MNANDPPAAPPATTPSHAALRELPLGAIRPAGWLADQLRLQAAGLTGRLEEVWGDVGPTSGWLGGPGESWERGPYYLDGLVPLAHVLGDQDLIDRASPWIEWILSSQTISGSFGPASNADWWPRMVALKVLTQHADATGDPRVEPFLGAYFRYQLEHLPARPLESWGRARGAENALSVLWLHERTGAPWLLDLVDLVLGQTLDWGAYLSRDLVTGRARRFDHRTHGPNVAMGLKTDAVRYLRDGDPRHLVRTEEAFAALDRWHGQVHGWFSGDEWLGGREATAGVETCQVVEAMFTCETLARVFGTGMHGDRLESLAYNLLPAACDPRMLAHQYHQQANQVEVSVGRRSWTYSGDDANVFGLEPHFGCCTANVHQGWPKLVRSLWMRAPDDGLVAVAYGPCMVRTTVHGLPVSLEVDTAYPFEESIRVRVGPAHPTRFAISLRVPQWCAAPVVAVAGSPCSVEPRSGYIRIERLWSPDDVVELTFPSPPRVVRRERQAVGVRCGALVMALSPGEGWQPVADAPGLGEWEVRPRRTWGYGLLLDDGPASWMVTRTPVGPVPFALAGAPVSVRAQGAMVPGWRMRGAEAAPPPESPVLDARWVEEVTLVPYGCARLRVAELPTIGPIAGGTP